jgi:hypothetical protein
MLWQLGAAKISFLLGENMKKLVIATAALLAATFVSGSAFAVPGSAAKGLEAPATLVKLS